MTGTREEAPRRAGREGLTEDGRAEGRREDGEAGAEPGEGAQRRARAVQEPQGEAQEGADGGNGDHDYAFKG